MPSLRARLIRIFGTTVPECGTILIPIPTSPPTTPPYTVIIWPSDSSLPERYPLNLTGQTASWAVVYKADTVFTLSTVDSKGEPVGYPAEYTVQATNGTTACLANRVQDTATSPLQVKIDMATTSVFQTCDPLLLHISGGQKPYHVNVVPASVAPATNISMGIDDDTLYWVNPFPTHTEFILAAADSQGASKFALKYPIEDVDGPNITTTNCPGPATHSFNSNNPNGNSSSSINIASSTASINIGNSTNDHNENSENSANSANSSTGSNGVRAAAIAGAVGGVMLLALLFILFYRRKGRGLGFWGKGHHHTPDSAPDPVLIGDAATGMPVKQIHFPSGPSGSRYYTKPPISPWDTGVTTTESMGATSSKAAMAAQERGEVSPTSSAPQVIQHRDGGGVADHPPAYRNAPIR